MRFPFWVRGIKAIHYFIRIKVLSPGLPANYQAPEGFLKKHNAGRGRTHGGVVVGLDPTVASQVIATKSSFGSVFGVTDSSEIAFRQALVGGETTATTAVDLFIQASRQAYAPIQGSNTYDYAQISGDNQSVTSTLVSFTDPTLAGSATFMLGPPSPVSTPEHSTLTLLCLGIAGIAGFGWRRHQKQPA